MTVRQEDLEGALRDAGRVAGTAGAVVGLGCAFAITRAVLPGMGAVGWIAALFLGALLGTGCGALAGRALAR